jgi:hypothetical protein
MPQTAGGEDQQLNHLTPRLGLSTTWDPPTLSLRNHAR